MKKKELESKSIVPTPEEFDVKDDNKSNKKAKKDVRLKLKYRTHENDISYRAPLSYRHLRILAWIFLAVTQIGTVFSIASKVDTTSGFDYATGSSIIEFFSSFPFVLFLLANFGIILRNRNNFRYLFVFYGGVMVGMYVLANLVVLHYVYGSIHTMVPDTSFKDVSIMAALALMHMGTTGYMFNLFVDLFLCVLTVFFVFYCPKHKYLQGKNVIFFRALVIIPIAYEIASIVIKQYTLLGVINIPSYVFFLLTSKPPLTFAAFFIVTIILKVREYRFLKLYNFDYKLLEENISTRAHSFRTSITIAIVFVIISHVDFIIMITYMIVEAVKLGEVDDIAFDFILERAQSIGLGGSTTLFLVAPIALLYSYTKVHQNKKIDSFLPIIGIGLVVFTIVEGLYLTLRTTVLKSIGQLVDSMSGTDEGGDYILVDGDSDYEAKRFTIPFELYAIKNQIYSYIHPVR